MHADKMRRWGTKQDVVGNLILDWTDILKDLNKFSPSGGIIPTPKYIVCTYDQISCSLSSQYIFPNLGLIKTYDSDVYYGWRFFKRSADLQKLILCFRAFVQ